MNYPPTCITIPDRLAFTYLAQEKLRITHNLMGRWRREGINRGSWGSLPPAIKGAFPYYASILSLPDWTRFQGDFFEPKSKRLMEEISRNRVACQSLTQWEVDEDNL